ncbi:PLP-dependent cysteine synthase family protein [Microbacterium suwonense]|uniref:Tryptophan synthase beta chain-like PALP domain-containing protein n=1 Tax=Microbacterium suwonense TaxID=683047 RepID=A0ABM8FSK2_9MICO|nr:pyridoxal-phosphate dependent enzyme [Microbacterium suwonense]BDZ38657.1 hypothetical protein GCM10025863_12710 [Microbacterium suwonense]
MAGIHSDITTAFGNTPLVRLNRVTEGLSATVLAKLEFYNPASSVKDRIGIAMVDAAEASGQLKPGGTIVEATSGNTGIALAMVGAARGYRVILTMPGSMSKERRVLLRAFGAEIVLTDPHKGMTGSIDVLKEIIAENPDAVWVRQFENEANPKIHRETTGQEILRDTDGQVDIVVAGVGTGGTVTGVGQALKAAKPEVQVIAVEPKDSPCSARGTPGRIAFRASDRTSCPMCSTVSCSMRCSPSSTTTRCAPPAISPPRRACSWACPPGRPCGRR